MGGSSRLKVVLPVLLRPFILSPAARRRLPYTSAAVRIVFGLLMVHQFLDMCGVAVVTGDRAGLTRAVCAVMVVAGLGVAVGFLTPFCLLVLLVRGYAYYPVVANLGNMVSVMLCWGLILQNAGRVWSMDGLVLAWWRRRTGGSGWMPDPETSPVYFAAVRAFVLTLYWIVCFQAMVFHFEDAFWQQGQVLQVVLTLPYFNDNAALFEAFREAAPSWFVTFCCAGLLIQGVWELLLIPLMYFRWGRVFVVLQGLGFFAMSLVCLNLGYLPVVELCFWALVFAPLIPFPSRMTADADVKPAPRLSWVAGGLVAVMVLGTATSLARFVLFLGPGKVRERPIVARVYSDLQWANWGFGVREVSVFNRGDVGMGEAFFTLYEVDEAGSIIRLVPFQDAEGGRLRMLRNDLLYFNYSLQWQRAAREKCFQDRDFRNPTPYTLDLLRRITLLDALLASEEQPRRYRVDFYDRPMIVDRTPAGWGPPVRRYSLIVQVTAEDLEAHAVDRRLTFDLPPGHQGEERRTREALERGQSTE
jgi:hypothetical protein